MLVVHCYLCFTRMWRCLTNCHLIWALKPHLPAQGSDSMCPGQLSQARNGWRVSQAWHDPQFLPLWGRPRVKEDFLSYNSWISDTFPIARWCIVWYLSLSIWFLDSINRCQPSVWKWSESVNQKILILQWKSITYANIFDDSDINLEISASALIDK